MSKDSGWGTLAVLVVDDRDSRAMLAHPVLCKGRGQDETVAQAVEDVLAQAVEDVWRLG